MKSRILIIVVSFIFMLCAIVFQVYTTYYLHSATNKTIIRDNSDYAALITNNYPSAKDTFTVTDTKSLQKNWVIVTIKNKNNNDTLRAVINDPTNSVAGMRLVLGPSATFSNYELTQHTNIPDNIYKELGL